MAHGESCAPLCILTCRQLIQGYKCAFFDVRSVSANDNYYTISYGMCKKMDACPLFFVTLQH